MLISPLSTYVGIPLSLLLFPGRISLIPAGCSGWHEGAAAANFMGKFRLAGGVQRLLERGREQQTVRPADFSLSLRESAPRWETSLSVSKQKALISVRNVCTMFLPVAVSNSAWKHKYFY